MVDNKVFGLGTTDVWINYIIYSSEILNKSIFFHLVSYINSLIPASLSEKGGLKGYWQILGRGKYYQWLLYLHWKWPKVALEYPPINIKY